MNRAKPRKQLSIDSQQEFETTRQTWAYPQTTRDNYADKREGQTMFDFLKRRKKYAIQQSISKRKQSPSKQSRHNQSLLNQTDRTALNRTPNRLIANKTPDISSIKQMERLDDEECTTPRTPRMSLAEKPSRVSRSLLEVLSPFRRRAGEDSVKENVAANTSYRSIKPDKNIQNQKIIAKIVGLGENLDACSKTANTCRIRSYSLLTSAIELLDDLSKHTTGHNNNKKRTSQLRQSLKSLQPLYKQFQSIISHLSIDQLLKSVKQKLSHIQLHSQKQNRQAIQSSLASSVKHYEKQLKAKDKELEKTRRELEKLQHKFEKQRQKEREVEGERGREDERRERDVREKVKEWKVREAELIRLNKQLDQEVRELATEVKKLQRENKTLEHQKAALVKSFDQERGSVQTAKQKVLLEQISRLKRQYDVDLTKIQDLYKMKQIKLIDDIHRLQLLLRDQQGRHKHCAQSEDINVQQQNVLRTQIHQLFAQNDKFRLVVRRLEQQSYILWGALKDVKVLSCRLGIFNKFSRIYDDIRFSDVAPR